MSKAKKVLKVVGLCALFLVVVIGLLVAAIFVYSHVEAQDYKRDIDAQMQEFRENGKSESGEAVKLRDIPFGELLNPEYAKIKNVEDDYKKCFNDLTQYYADKEDYETKTKAYNEARANGEDPAGGDELAKQYDELQQSMEQLNKDKDELKEKFNN